MFDYLIVGAGFAGSVMAERLAADADKKVLIIDKRNHIGGIGQNLPCLAGGGDFAEEDEHECQADSNCHPRL